MAENLVLRPDFLDGANTPTPWRTWATNTWVAPTPDDAGAITLAKSTTYKSFVYESVTAEFGPGTYVAYVDVQGPGTLQLTLAPNAGSATGQHTISTALEVPGETRQTVVTTFTLQATDAKGNPIPTQQWHLRVNATDPYNPYRGTVKFYGARIDRQAEPDHVGVFSGATPDTDTERHEWAGEPYESTSTLEVVEPDPDPEPPGEPADPSPDPATIPARVLVLTGQEGDPAAEALARQCVEIVTMLVRAYTRNRGFGYRMDDDTGESVPTIAADIQSVILTAAVRLMSNTAQLAYTAGAETVRDAFKGWSLAETAALNPYRRRWA